MKEILAPRLTDLAREFINASIPFIARGYEDDDETDKKEISEGRKLLGPWCKKVYGEAKALGLQSTIRQAARVAGLAANGTPQEINDEITQLERRFDEETESLKLFYIPPDKITFYNQTNLFGEEFKANFPIANTEIIEAGNCFAFDRLPHARFILCARSK